MSDIVERLLAPAYWISGSSEGHEGDNSAPVEAAKTIASLRDELAKVNMENDRLTRTNQAKREHRDKLLEATAKQAAEIERLRAALRPFAGYTNSEEYIKSGPDDGWCAAISYQVKHYRQARAALEERT